MKITLRLIGVLAALSVLGTALFLVRFVSVGLPALVATGAFGVITIGGWVVTFIAGPIAFVQLLRVRNSGRVAATVLFGYMLFYYVLGLLAFREANARVAPVVWLSVFLAIIVAILLSPLARRTCVGVRALEMLSE